jgi:glutamyl-tRNA synthetase
MPLLRNTDKSKISKRKNPAARLTWFVEQGYLPEALRNFLQLLAYPPVVEGEDVASFEEFVAAFDWAKVNTTGPIFDLAKLNALNGHYIRALSADELADRVVEFAVREGQWTQPSEHDVALLRKAVPLVQERLVLLSEAVPKLAYLFTPDAELEIDPDALAKTGPDAAAVVAAATTALAGLGEWNHEAIQAALREALVEGLGIKPKFAFGPVRLAVTGSNVSPPLFESMELLGRESSLARMAKLAARL